MKYWLYNISDPILPPTNSQNYAVAREWPLFTAKFYLTCEKCFFRASNTSLKKFASSFSVTSFLCLVVYIKRFLLIAMHIVILFSLKQRNCSTRMQ